MDDTERKMFAQFDDDMPAQRVNALELLREHLQKKTPRQFFRDFIAEIEAAEKTAARGVELEKEVAVLKQASAADHQNFNQRYNKLAADYASLQRRINLLLPVKRHWKRLAAGLAAPVIAAGLWCFYPTETAAHRAAVDAEFKELAATLKWAPGGEYSDPVVILAAKQPYWVIARFDANSAHENAGGAVVTVQCVHLYAAPAEPDAGVFLKPHPYSLFGFGWLRWPERGTDCKPETFRSAGK